MPDRSTPRAGSLAVPSKTLMPKSIRPSVWLYLAAKSGCHLPDELSYSTRSSSTTTDARKRPLPPGNVRFRCQDMPSSSSTPQSDDQAA